MTRAEQSLTEKVADTDTFEKAVKSNNDGGLIFRSLFAFLVGVGVAGDGGVLLSRVFY